MKESFRLTLESEFAKTDEQYVKTYQERSEVTNERRLYNEVCFLSVFIFPLFFISCIIYLVLIYRAAITSFARGFGPNSEVHKLTATRFMKRPDLLPVCLPVLRSCFLPVAASHRAAYPHRISSPPTRTLSTYLHKHTDIHVIAHRSSLLHHQSAYLSLLSFDLTYVIDTSIHMSPQPSPLLSSFLLFP